MKLKANIAAALGAQAQLVEDSLNAMGNRPMDARERFHLTRLELALVDSADSRELAEP